MPLTFAGKGKFKVNRINGGNTVKNRLAKMGIIEGGFLEVSNAHYGCPVVVQLQGAQYGIGIGVASKIDVIPVA